MMRVDNWPPGYATSLEPPPGLVAEIDAAEARLAALKARASEWLANTLARHTIAWIAYHDRHGWPDDAGYEIRLRAKAASNPLPNGCPPLQPATDEEAGR